MSLQYGNMKPRLVAAIPARSGSKRIKNKNVIPLMGHPLLAYSIKAAAESGLFEKIFVVTDDQDYAEIALKYGASVPSLRPKETSGDRSPDIKWVQYCIQNWDLETYDYLAILRPTSPLRRSVDILDAWEKLKLHPTADSVRAISKSSLHPGKMWTLYGDVILPLLPFLADGTIWHSSQISNLPEVFFQNASLEITKISAIIKTNSISGCVVTSYLSDEYSGLDINEPLDLEFIKFILDRGLVTLPKF